MMKANKPFTVKRGEKALREKTSIMDKECKHGEPIVVGVGNGEHCSLKGRYCFEVVSTCDIWKGYEQGKKDALKNSLFSPYAKAEFRDKIRKQTLKEVLKEIKLSWHSKKKGFDLYVLRGRLEQELKEVSEPSGSDKELKKASK